MATVFPQAIQTFPNFKDITVQDAPLVKQYQEAMKNGNIAQANQYLAQISNYQNKIITAQLMNTIVDTCEAVQEFYEQKFSPAYIVSTTQPAVQAIGDFWFHITKG